MVDNFTRRQFEMLLAQSSKAIKQGYLSMAETMLTSIIALVSHVSKVTSDAMNVVTKISADEVAGAVLIMGSPVKDWFIKQSIDMAFSFAGTMKTVLTDNLTVSQAIAKVKPILDDVADRNIRTLVNTTINAAASHARSIVYEKNLDVMLGIQQISTLDGHTSEICMAYSGAKWTVPDHKPIDGAPAYNGGTPRHFNCRSVIVPITKFSSEPGQRVSELGLVSRDISFDEFLKRKTKAQQDEMLGIGKADLWRAGKITLRDLVTQSGRPLTLEQLARGQND